MTSLAHDGAASLRVHYRRAAQGCRVVRACPCHWGESITVLFDTEEQAEHALAFLDEDARRQYGSPPPSGP